MDFPNKDIDNNKSSNFNYNCDKVNFDKISHKSEKNNKYSISPNSKNKNIKRVSIKKKPNLKIITPKSDDDNFNNLIQVVKIAMIISDRLAIQIISKIKKDH